MMHAKPTYEQIVAYASGELKSDDAETVRQYLLKNDSAANEYASIQAIISAMRADRSVSAPADSIAAAKSIFRPQPAVTPWWKRLAEIAAEVVFDSRMQPALAGYRSSPGSGFQIAVESDAGGVDLQFEPQDETREHWRIMGQVSPADGPNAEVAILMTAGDASVQEASADDSGFFSLTIDRGDYDLCIRVRDRVLRVPGIRVD